MCCLRALEPHLAPLPALQGPLAAACSLAPSLARSLARPSIPPLARVRISSSQGSVAVGRAFPSSLASAPLSRFAPPRLALVGPALSLGPAFPRSALLHMLRFVQRHRASAASHPRRSPDAPLRLLFVVVGDRCRCAWRGVPAPHAPHAPMLLMLLMPAKCLCAPASFLCLACTALHPWRVVPSAFWRYPSRAPSHSFRFWCHRQLLRLISRILPCLKLFSPDTRLPSLCHSHLYTPIPPLRPLADARRVLTHLSVLAVVCIASTAWPLSLKDPSHLPNTRPIPINSPLLDQRSTLLSPSRLA